MGESTALWASSENMSASTSSGWEGYPQDTQGRQGWERAHHAHLGQEGGCRTCRGQQGLNGNTHGHLPRGGGGGQPDSKPDWHETGHEGACFFDIGEFIDNKENGVDVLHGDVDILNEFWYGGVIRQKPEVARRAAELSIHGNHAEKVANGGKRAFTHMPSFIRQQAKV